MQQHKSRGPLASLSNSTPFSVQVQKLSGAGNAVSGKFVLKESENNINVGLAHMTLPPAQQLIQNQMDTDTPEL